MNITTLRQRGFSLLEVLIAVAILAFGLLAITSLQASLIRNSGEAKARSVGLSLAKDKLEDLRSFRTMDDYFNAIVPGTATTQTVGGVTYTTTTTVTRYGFNRDPNNDGNEADAAFQAITDLTTQTPTGNFVSENEFKRVSVSVGWTDATNQSQTVVVEDAIGAVAPENTGKLARRNPDALDRKPQILIVNPANEAGVIPIAIGDGSETAATNPRPEVISGNVVGTSFDIFTFAALVNSANALAQSRVENFIVGCTCDYGQATTQVDYRPTYWDGERYVAPEEATGYSVQAGESRRAPVQSVLCGACCRDHHDPSGVSGALFSPRNDGPHRHYALGSNFATASTGEYIEACRMIRVDGIFRVAADPYNEYTNTLRTAIKTGDTAFYTDTVPDSTASSRYVNFVIDYLETQGGQNNPNTQLSQAVADGKAATANLNDGTQDLAIGGVRWNHARGLYIDWLEPDAKDAISESAADCQPPLTASQCLLRVLPFTSINLTELATWTAGSPAFTVDNNAFITTLNQVNPTRGRVVGYNGGTANASASIRTSTTGLLANDSIVLNPWDKLSSPQASARNVLDQPDGDEQSFRVVAPPPPSCGIVSTTSPNISRNNFHEFSSSASCVGSDAAKPREATVVELTITAGSGPSAARVQLIAPDGSTYDVGTNPINFNALSGVYSFAAIGAPNTAGTWKLKVTNTTNPATTATLSFSVAFKYTATFTMQLVNYTFQTSMSTVPTFDMTPTGSCEFKTPQSPPVLNPITCAMTQPGVTTTMLMKKYNHSEKLFTAGNMVCKKGAASVTCPVTNPIVCKNFTAVSASVNGGTPILGAAPTNDGKVGETTLFTFNGGFSQGASIAITMAEGTASQAPCTVNNNQCAGYQVQDCP